MKRILIVLAMLGSAGSIAHAQHQGRDAHGHAGPGGMSGHDVAQYCSTEFDKVIGDGRGFGLAFAADQNGYPGPLHVLELKDRLRLSAQQETAMRARLDAMFAEARPKSQRLLHAEARLRRLFADGTVSEDKLVAAVADAERARGDLRLVHLKFHLGTREMLSEEQRRLYQEARWGSR